MKKVFIFGVPILVLAFVVIAFAAPRFGFSGFGGGRGHFRSKNAEDFLSWKMDRLSQELNLNSAQQTKLNDIKNNLTSMMEQRFETRKSTRGQILSELQKDNPDISKITPLIDQQIDAKAQAAHNLVAQFADFYNQLDPNQKKLFASHFAQRMQPQKD